MDMVGNVWEWCFNPFDAPDRDDLTGETRRALRGGSWHSSQVFARAAYRNAGSPASSSGSLGFRVVINLSAPEKRAR
jgi:sulfatase modifying factor 1